VGDHPDGNLPRHVLALHKRPDGIKPEAHARRENLRANPLAADAWILAILTGLLGFGGLLALVSIMARLVALPEAAPIMPPYRYAGNDHVHAFGDVVGRRRRD
jgi:hypothetical protein